MVRSFTDPPDALLDHDEWILESPRGERRTMKLLEGAPYRQGLRVLLSGVTERNGAQALTGWMIKVVRSALPPLAEREHYRDDLLGFEVANLEGEALGEVSHFVDLPAGSVMVVKGAREHWVPAVPKHLHKIDSAQRSIVVDWPSELA